jgi:predicted lipoprotein
LNFCRCASCPASDAGTTRSVRPIDSQRWRSQTSWQTPSYSVPFFSALNHASQTDVRFYPNSGHSVVVHRCPLCANSGHSPGSRATWRWKPPFAAGQS